MKFYFCSLLTIAIFTMFEKTMASNMILTWNASLSPNVIGYHVYYGTTSGNYPYKVNPGNATQITISNLSAGLAYYFVATAYTAGGQESAFSAAIKVSIPATTQIITKPLSTPVSTIPSRSGSQRPAAGQNIMPSVSPQKSVVLELEKSSTAVISPAPSVAVIPEAPSLAISQTAGPCSPAAIQFPARQGHWYEVQATTDLRNWCSIWQSGTAAADGSMQFTDPDAKSFALRFYRLVAH